MTTPTPLELAKWLEDHASFERSKLQWNPSADLSVAAKYSSAAQGLRDLAAAQEALAKAEKERDFAKTSADWFGGQVKMFQALADNGQAAIVERAIAAEARAEASEKDAARYRWLRNPSLPVAIAIDGDYPFAIDAAIDAAIAEGKS